MELGRSRRTLMMLLLPRPPAARFAPDLSNNGKQGDC
jgi:hypothetical protein